jgi:hypothetical protein
MNMSFDATADIHLFLQDKETGAKMNRMAGK